MHILVVEDDQLVSEFVSEGFTAEGHAVSVADTGENAMELLDLYKFDLIILDLVLPGMGGLDICKTIRRRGDAIPIIVLSTAGAVETKLEMFRLGADDYVSKPFNFEELQMRVDALFRRAQSVSVPNLTGESQSVGIGALRLNRLSAETKYKDEKVDLTNTEFAILDYLMQMPDQIVSRQRLLNRIWNVNKNPMTNVIDVHVGHLRRKVSRAGLDGHKLISSVYGRGFKLNTDILVAD